MSFSSDIKQELNKSSNLANKELVKYELIGYLISGNTSITKRKIRFATESDYNINRFSKLLSNLNINHDIEVSGKMFVITVQSRNVDIVNIKDDNIYVKELEGNIKNEYKRAIIRGIFMGSGSINNPENTYHLEITLSNNENMQFVSKILNEFGIYPKRLIAKNKNKYSIYLKDGEEISNFICIIEANNAVMNFENIRIKKEMRGKVNRLVNCKTANLNKTLNAAVEQIAAIKKLQKNKKFNKLDDNLKEIAILRLENPEMTLLDLGKNLKEPLGKSGVNYRLKKIMEIADEG